MRMWGVNPKMLCRQHLLGEHVEMHMFAGTIRKGRSIDGYIVDPSRIKIRHDELVIEMVSRGMKHKSPLEMDCSGLQHRPIVEMDSIAELNRRCPNCAKEDTMKTTKELVNDYNTLAEKLGKPTIGEKTFNSKSKLLSKMEELAALVPAVPVVQKKTKISKLRDALKPGSSIHRDELMKITDYDKKNLHVSLASLRREGMAIDFDRKTEYFTNLGA